MLKKAGTTLILAAKTPTLGIGSKGNLPWRLKKDMAFFRQATLDGVVIMGRRTWESIPERFRPLKSRVNIVVTSSYNSFTEKGEFVHAVGSYQDALSLSEKTYPQKQVFVIGGGQLYSTALTHPATKHILLTEIYDPQDSVECDTFFIGKGFDWYPIDQNPPKEAEWVRKDESQLKSFLGDNVEIPTQPVVENDLSYTFTLWEKE
ncbi:hypothetical protein TRICI_005899 [Trichomonascus ciferrii]|uniref:Dihydrofolate reductase n=1 Tax=Trichomonascus ciferrii TaxID=44093 RepID=A0A642UP79_9ASCO|nr:hypothetical protein TRICI_005899 [Trichomonascus ciferrii]